MFYTICDEGFIYELFCARLLFPTNRYPGTPLSLE
jgi:hypothetical protein